MFTINRRKIVYSSADTIDNINGKISIALGTIPPLLDIQNLNVEEGGIYNVEEPIFFIDPTEPNTIQIRRCGNDAISWRKIVSKEIDLDVGFLKKLYVIAKINFILKGMQNLDENTALNFALYDIDSELKSSNDDIWYNRSITITKFQTMISDNQKNIEKQSKTINIWAQIIPAFSNTPFVMNRINYDIEIPNFNNKNELMVFDSIKLDDVIMGCFYQEMIKYNPEYTSFINDYFNLEDKLFLSKKKTRIWNSIRVIINFKEISGIVTKTKYRIIYIFVQEDKIIFTTQSLINETKVIDNLKNMVQNIILNMNESLDHKQEKDFYYGQYSALIHIPLFVIKELVTNDPSVYSICYINESSIISTRQSQLNLYFKDTHNQGIGIGLSKTINGTLVRIKKIRGGDNLQERLHSVILLTNKILQYSYQKVDATLKYYQKYINLQVEMKPLEENIQEEENNLKNQVPELFVPNYTRLCNKPPIIVNIKEEEQVNSEILKFPIYGEAEARFYKCPYPDYKFPGLRENTRLPNKNIFPFVPCCYQKSQQKSRNYKMYYNQELYEQRINSGEIGKTLKILSPKRIGALPPKIDKLLNYTTGIKFYRYGIPISVNSCLDVLNMATSKNENVENIRLELSKRVELCKAELSHLTTNEIIKKILDPKTYINPRLFKGALEDYYQISYILFSLDKDNFSEYPSQYVKFICPLKKRVILMMEHEENEHIEMIMDEETMNYVNKLGKRPIFTFEKNDFQTKKIFSLYKERFKFILYDINKRTLTSPIDNDIFYTYPWEIVSPNGRVVRLAEPLSQYVDSFGQTRLIELKFDDIIFVGNFSPLPCLKVPIKNLNSFTTINKKLNSTQINAILTKFPNITLYSTELNTSEGYISPYMTYKNMKRLAEYLMWASCHAFSIWYLEEQEGAIKSVDIWIDNYTRVVPNYTYSRVQIKPFFNLAELMVDGKVIYNSVEFQERIRFNLSLISSINLRFYLTNIYYSFYKDISNFNVEYPAQLAMNKQEYYERTRDSFTLHILSSRNIQYIQPNKLYFIKELFGYFQNNLCLFVTSIDNLSEMATKLMFKTTSGQTKMLITVFNQDQINQYLLGDEEPSLNVIVININTNWFYGLILPNS